MIKENGKEKISTEKIAIYGVLMALTTVATMVISIPSIATKGYINLGDGIVLLSGLVLGPAGGFIVGGLGSTLADILLGYAYYAPFTLAIKGLEGFLGVFLYNKFFKWKFLLAPLALAGIWMAAGYFLVETFMYTLPAAIASLPGNLIQGLVGALLSLLLYKNIKNKIK